MVTLGSESSTAKRLYKAPPSTTSSFALEAALYSDPSQHGRISEYVTMFDPNDRYLMLTIEEHPSDSTSRLFDVDWASGFLPAQLNSRSYDSVPVTLIKTLRTVIGNEDEVQRWLDTPNPELYNRSPCSLIEEGQALLVEGTVYRAVMGIPS